MARIDSLILIGIAAFSAAYLDLPSIAGFAALVAIGWVFLVWRLTDGSFLPIRLLIVLLAIFLPPLVAIPAFVLWRRRREHRRNLKTELTRVDGPYSTISGHPHEP